MTVASLPTGKILHRKHKNDLGLALGFLTPATIGLVIFFIYPLIRGIYLSFTKYNLFTDPQFVGLDNYSRMMKDPVFWNAIRVTIEYVVINIGIQTIVALVIAVLMQRLTESTFVRSVVLSPFLVSNVVVALVWLWILDTSFGITNAVITSLGGHAINFFSSELAIPTIAMINVWRHMGYTALLLFAGLQGIPGTLYEAGKIDGASERRMFFSITLPLLRPILGLVLIMSVIGSFQVFDTVSVTTGGGPVNASRVLQMYMYDLAFGRFQFGYACALSVALLLILMAVTFIQYRMTNAGSTDLD
ncbi:carbohydrate ABC transporter permease [Actinomyces vulturis]|uniref:carbohydrate ABC transporter permease n=1 Tax=Actinomyces vulturis TaxID=1857645 RepID=UPI0008375813|nr:sugar ABC transporter permease [Actinomyces vulturis]